MSLPFTTIVATQDWHPKDHISFASNHSAPNNQPFTSSISLSNPAPEAKGGPPEKPQRLWPVHCVQNTPGAEIIEELEVKHVELFVKKGMDPNMEM